MFEVLRLVHQHNELKVKMHARWDFQIEKGRDLTLFYAKTLTPIHKSKKQSNNVKYKRTDALSLWHQQ